VTLAEESGQSTDASSGRQCRQYGGSCGAACGSQDSASASEGSNCGRQGGHKRANLLPVVAQLDLHARELRYVTADGARVSSCARMRARSIPIPSKSLTAASNSASLCNAPMISRNSLICRASLSKYDAKAFGSTARHRAELEAELSDLGKEPIVPSNGSRARRRSVIPSQTAHLAGVFLWAIRTKNPAQALDDVAAPFPNGALIRWPALYGAFVADVCPLNLPS
jgi:hypothetical protein